MVRTIRYSIGKTDEDIKNKINKIHEFDEIVTRELDFRQKIISLQTIITKDDEEIMIATIGDQKETRTPTSIGTIIIVLLLIIIAFKVW